MKIEFSFAGAPVTSSRVEVLIWSQIAPPSKLRSTLPSKETAQPFCVSRKRMSASSSRKASGVKP